MRIVDPKQFRHGKTIKKKRRLPYAIFLCVLAVGLLLLWWQNNKSSESGSNNVSNQLKNAQTAGEKIDLSGEKELRVFKDNELKIFYDNLLLPNLQRIENPPVIFDNIEADAHIRELAEKRGYRLRSEPTIKLVTIEGNLLQPLVKKPWIKMKAAAAEDGLDLRLVSGYRSVAEQRVIFIQRLAAIGVGVSSILEGQADKKINQVLITTSIPGYSRHHTGYTLDLACGEYAFERFVDSVCHKWLTADNYKRAKIHGFIPSYPPKAEAQGPNPEAWEYVWVGTELLYE